MRKAASNGLFPRSAAYRVGARLTDNDHKELVAQAGTRPQIAASLAFPVRYVKENFAREKALMADYGYPDLAAHRESHRRLRARIHATRRVFATDPSRFDPQ